jgi:hypothetical protein
VAAAWLFGSLARGDADELSDVDVFVALLHDRSADELDRVDVWLRELGERCRWREDPYNAPDGGRYLEAVYPADPIPLVVDSYWQPVSASRRASDTRLLFDKVGVRRAAPGLTTYALIPAVRHGLPVVLSRRPHGLDARAGRGVLVRPGHRRQTSSPPLGSVQRGGCRPVVADGRDGRRRGRRY